MGDRKDSFLADVARGLLRPDKRQELDRAIDSMLGPAEGGHLDAAASEVIAEAIGRVRQDRNADVPLVEIRERTLESGQIAAHILVSDPKIHVYRGEEGVLLRRKHDDWTYEAYLGFPPGEIETAKHGTDEGSIAQIVVFPEGYQERNSMDDYVEIDADAIEEAEEEPEDE